MTSRNDDELCVLQRVRETLNALLADQLDLKAHVDEGFAKVNTGIAQITALLRTLTGDTGEQGD